MLYLFIYLLTASDVSGGRLMMKEKTKPAWLYGFGREKQYHKNSEIRNEVHFRMSFLHFISASDCTSPDPIGHKYPKTKDDTCLLNSTHTTDYGPC